MYRFYPHHPPTRRWQSRRSRNSPASSSRRQAALRREHTHTTAGRESETSTRVSRRRHGSHARDAQHLLAAPGVTGKSDCFADAGEAPVYLALRHGRWVTSYSLAPPSSVHELSAFTVRTVVVSRPPVTMYLPAGSGNSGASMIRPSAHYARDDERHCRSVCSDVHEMGSRLKRTYAPRATSWKGRTASRREPYHPPPPAPGNY